jgi:hypothetical protein
MKKYISIIAVTIMAFSFTACETLKELGLSETEAAAAVRQALSVGSDTSVSRLSKTDGYFKDAAVKIFLPSEAQVVFDNLSAIPGGQALVDDLILSINRAAEDAATEALPIFKNAITNLTIGDAISIVNGNDTAGTHYLRQQTYTPLTNAFQPKIENSLSKPLILGTSTEQMYSDLIGVYNTASLNGFLFPMITDNTLSQYVTGRALNGLFLKVGEEERLIRQDPLHRVTALLQKVFGGGN